MKSSSNKSARLGKQNGIVCNGAPIVLPPRADAVAKLAASELARFLYTLTGVPSPVIDDVPKTGAAILLGLERARAVGAPADEPQLREDGYVIQAWKHRVMDVIIVAARRSRGLLYGVYALLEEFGVGFYLGGETFPEGRPPAVLPHGFCRVDNPAFKVRAHSLMNNTIIGRTGWGEDDYRAYLNQLARLRCNTLCWGWGFDHDAEMWEEEGGRVSNARPIMSSMTKPWRALAELRTSQFHFGTGDYFDEEIFGNPALAAHRDPIAQRQAICAAVRRAMRMAKANGLDIVAGFTAPVGDVNDPVDPTDRKVQEQFRRRVIRFLERYPDTDCFLLGNHESGGCSGTRPPTGHGSARRLFESQRPIFAYLGNGRRIWEAIRFGRFAQMAYDIIRKEAPRVKMGISGSGGDLWMCFGDYYLGYDKLLPPETIFAGNENLDTTTSRQVGRVWEQLPAARERWAVPVMENDNSDFWTPQPYVDGMRDLAQDALRKGCQGLIVLTWRARDFEEEVGFAARFAWNPGLTVEDFYQRFARDAFGKEQARRMAGHLLTLQRLGRRWTGVKGTPEIAEMIFTGAQPHLPFELGPAAARFLLPFARDAVKELGGTYAENMEFDNPIDNVPLFKVVRTPVRGTAAPVESSRLGVREFNEVIRILKTLTKTTDRERIQRELIRTREMIFGVRHRLIERGLTPAQFSAMDLYWIHAHQLALYTGAQTRLAALRLIAEDLRKLRATWVARKRFDHLERLDYLLANIDFVRHYDQVAMLLADGEAIPTAIARGKKLRKQGKIRPAAELAVKAYGTLLQAGMRAAVLALTHKLSAQCEWGILATVNIKPVLKYFEYVGELEALMPAAPPRQVYAQWRDGEVHLWWDAPSGNSKGFHVYRQDAGGGRAERLTHPLLPADIPVFIDRPKSGGRYRYTVTSVAADGWESPSSHSVEMVTGREAEGPRILVSRPVSVLRESEPVEVRAVVCGDSPVAEVTLYYRLHPSNEWRKKPMLRRFRCTYHSRIPLPVRQDGFLEFHIEARDINGKLSRWPVTAPSGRSWTATVIC